jgi:hypothetical protein
MRSGADPSLKPYMNLRMPQTQSAPATATAGAQAPSQPASSDGGFTMPSFSSLIGGLLAPFQSKKPTLAPQLAQRMNPDDINYAN